MLEHEFVAFAASPCDDFFVPCSKVWPMGFSWSSCVAQASLLAIAKDAGLDDSLVLACDAPLPANLSLAFAAATDDLMIFSDQGSGGTTAPTQAFEDALVRAGAAKNPSKDIDDVLSATCVGVDLVDGRFWATPSERLRDLLVAVTDLASTQLSSPAAVAAHLGAAQWYDLLRRLRLSVFDQVYSFAAGAKAKDWTVQCVATAVIDELLLDAVLSPFGTVDMHRPYLPFLGATDASSSFGHGACVAELPANELRSIARLACKAGDHVTLARGPELSEELSARLGPRHALGLSLGDFRVVLSVAVSEPQHINLEEGRALLRYVRWLLRSRSRFGHRVVVLIDSRVVIGAVTKGRSFSVPLNAILRRLAALCFAGGLILHCVFVPTSHNPSDWPSRGGPSTWPNELRHSRPKAASRTSRLVGTKTKERIRGKDRRACISNCAKLSSQHVLAGFVDHCVAESTSRLAPIIEEEFSDYNGDSDSYVL